MCWWPMVLDVVSRSRAKVWSVAKLCDLGATTEQMLSLYIARVRATVEYGAHVYGALINGVQSKEIEGVQTRCLQIILGSHS